MKEKSVPVQSRLEDKYAAALKQIADDRKLTVSSLVRILLTKYVEKKNG